MITFISIVDRRNIIERILNHVDIGKLQEDVATALAEGKSMVMLEAGFDVRATYVGAVDGQP